MNGSDQHYDFFIMYDIHLELSRKDFYLFYSLHI